MQRAVVLAVYHPNITGHIVTVPGMVAPNDGPDS
jgi:hypothetical protein